eukprot:CAMPEP_0113575944 /NCGR_PEP_ID=MMETSP0015_2-20120614/27996_1 /TAXON_ID=2838 /ORGANISM="Odontella" /LENGTH=550 /DNA_ID=CAMNT_0000479273 /DNA_START=1 /DNA_END=1653 /DNA_ORIENTATION=+ /assembly_acc=CAM_ASM_000160
MEFPTIKGTPSDVRRRLSGVLTADAEESARSVAGRRRSSLVSLDDAVEDMPKHKQGGGSTSRSRRASVITNFFAKSSTSFDYQERSIRPTVVMAMIYLKDPCPDVQKLRTVVADRLLEFPRFCSTFRQQDGAVFFDQLSRDEIDLEHHVQVKHGKGQFGEKETGDLITSSCLEWWDAEKPLWRMTLVKEMEGGRSMLFCKMDHAVGDGVALMSVLLSLLDDPPKEIRSLQSRREEKPTVALSQRIVNNIHGIYYGTIGWLLGGFDPENGLKIPREKKLEEFGSKTFSQVRPFSLGRVKAIKEELKGTTVNDVIVATLTIAMRKYFEKTNDPVLKKIDKGKDLHMSFVVNTRSQSSSSEKVTNLGNDFLVTSLPFELRYKSKIDAVWRSKASVDYLKLSPALYLLKIVTQKLLLLLPEEALIAAAVDNSFKPTAFVTNVMGPTFEATFAGYAVDDLNYLVSANIGLYFGVLSYNGKVNVSFTTDSLARVDCLLLKICVEEAFEGLEKDVMDASPGELKDPNLKSTAARLLEFAAPCAAAVALSYICKAFLK